MMLEKVENTEKYDVSMSTLNILPGLP
jgi:hypothetical protein